MRKRPAANYVVDGDLQRECQQQRDRCRNKAEQEDACEVRPVWFGQTQQLSQCGDVLCLALRFHQTFIAWNQRQFSCDLTDPEGHLSVVRESTIDGLLTEVP